MGSDVTMNSSPRSTITDSETVPFLHVYVNSNTQQTVDGSTCRCLLVRDASASGVDLS